jgi:two-component system chemotaxis response regulator CheB
MKQIFIKNGNLHLAKEPMMLECLVRESVAVCVFDKSKKTGGLAHFSFPSTRKATDENDNKIAKNAIINILKNFKEKIGSNKQDLEIKLVGGSTTGVDQVGLANIKVAKKLLNSFGLSVKAESTGGEFNKKIQFNSQNGDIKIKTLKSLITLNKNTDNTLDKIIKVMIIDDSKPVRMVLRKIIEAQKNMEVVGEAENPYEAMELRKTILPDVITLDINMPKMDGITYLKNYMTSDPIPTIIVTDYNLEDSGPVFEGLENGAFDYVKKPSIKDIESLSNELTSRITGAYKSSGSRLKNIINHRSQNKVRESFDASEYNIKKHMIVLGASTGGTEAIKEVLSTMPANIPTILIVQHIPPVFSKAFAERLDSLMPFKVKEAEDCEEVKDGTVYIAPGGMHMKLAKTQTMRIKLTDDPPVNRFKPSVDYLFKSVKKRTNKRVIGVLLTGMGCDGADGLLELRANGAKTIAQDEKSCVVFGMPGTAIEIGAAEHIESLDKVTNRICSIINTSEKNGETEAA